MPGPDYAKLPALMLYEGQTYHTRFAPFERSFSYKLFLIDLDIDRLQEAKAQTHCFGVEQMRLFSFCRRDHGYRKDVPLRPWAEAMFQKAGIDLQGGAIRLVTLPRHLFYKFSPISLWYGYGPGGKLAGIIYEVNNTFGDTHAYVAHATTDRSQHEACKQLFVSPFFDVSGKYRFTLRAPDELLSVTVENIVDGERTHMANIKARRSAATNAAFLKAAITRPFSTLGVSLAIHYEAFFLWLKKAGYRARPPAPLTAMTEAKHMNSSVTQTERLS